MNGVVAVLLVIYNEERYLKPLLHSLKKQSYPQIKIYAIDNYSKDNSVSIIKSIIPEVYLIKSKENLGFAKANNIIASKAFKDNPDYLFILNTDIVLDYDCISELVKLAESDDKIGIISPIVFFGNENKKINKIQSYVECGDFKSGKTYSIHGGLIFEESNLPEIVEVNIIHGGTTFLKADVYKHIGLFDERFFMYGEEIDLAYKITKTNYKMYVTSKAKCWHFHDWSKQNMRRHYLQYYYMNRNRYLYLKKYKLINYLIINLFKELFYFPFTLVWSLRKYNIKFLRYYYLGIFNGLRGEIGKTKINFD